jgi:transcriptional regulator GlxA family with amidase domain
MASPRRIVLVAFPGVQILDVTGPCEVFSQADRASASREYDLDVVSPDGAAVTTSSGVQLIADRSFHSCRGRIDTLMVAGGLGTREAARDERLVSWLRLAARRSRRVASVCTGAFLLARAGLLDDRRATTHWASCAALARNYPSIDVDPDPIYVRDGDVYTSAGVTAGIDLALALVEEDLGSAAALRAARNLVLFFRRPGGQAQFSSALAGQSASRSSIRELQAWLADHVAGDLSVSALAERSFMSPRNFSRVFTRETGVTPGAYVEALRVERARALLETTDLPVEDVARRCGFGTPETFRRAFGRRVGVNPTRYRTSFATAQVIPIRKATA